MNGRDYTFEVNAAKYRIIVWLVATVVLVFTVMANFSALDVIVRGPGTVIPASQTQIVQSLEGGILAELLVHEGDVVSKDDVLAQLSDTRFRGAFGELEKQHGALQVRLQRLQAELDEVGLFEIPASLKTVESDTVRSETQLFNARWNDYTQTRESHLQSVALYKKEVNLLRDLAGKEIVSEMELIKAQQKFGQAEAKAVEHQSKYQLQVADEYTSTLSELKQLKQNMMVRRDQLSRTTLQAPTRSIVNHIAVSTIGGVIGPGEEIMELIPLDDDLKIEAKISPRDIAFVFPQMSATIKLTAYDYTVYGNLSGQVTHISADTFDDGPGEDTPSYYKVIIEVDPRSIAEAKGKIEIRPGMQAEAELQVGTKTVLQYLLKPLFKTREALREP